MKEAASVLWRLGLLIVIAAAVVIPAQMRAVAVVRDRPAMGWPATLVPTIVLATVVFLIAAVGTLAAGRVGLRAPVLDPSAGGGTLPRLLRSIGWGVAAGVLLSATLLPFYYLVMRPLFDPQAFALTETVRKAMGLPGRIAMGGVIEEVVFRWAALAVLAWIGMRATGEVRAGVRWAATLGAALLFGLVHLPGAAALGISLGPALVVAGLAMNGALGVAAGWLSWSQGLVAAMAAHSTVHAIWFLVESLIRD